MVCCINPKHTYLPMSERRADSCTHIHRYMCVSVSVCACVSSVAPFHLCVRVHQKIDGERETATERENQLMTKSNEREARPNGEVEKRKKEQLSMDFLRDTSMFMPFIDPRLFKRMLRVFCVFLLCECVVFVCHIHYCEIKSRKKTKFYTNKSTDRTDSLHFMCSIYLFYTFPGGC